MFSRIGGCEIELYNWPKIVFLEIFEKNKPTVTFFHCKISYCVDGNGDRKTRCFDNLTFFEMVFQCLCSCRGSALPE